MKKFIIDRFEGVYAICENEDKSLVPIPKYKLPLEMKEGDTLIQHEDETFHVDDNDTKNNNNRIRNKMNKLFE